jgi:hypothetical protein
MAQYPHVEIWEYPWGCFGNLFTVFWQFSEPVWQKRGSICHYGL